LSELRALETPLPATDLIIAAQVLNKNLVLVTRDKYFKTLREIVARDLELEIE